MKDSYEEDFEFKSRDDWEDEEEEYLEPEYDDVEWLSFSLFFYWLHKREYIPTAGVEPATSPG